MSKNQGCQTQASADRNNAKANVIIQTKFGKDWKQKFKQKYKLIVAIPGT